MNRTNRTARRALVARVESMEERIALAGNTYLYFGPHYTPPGVYTTITRIQNANTPTLSNESFGPHYTPQGGGYTAITLIHNMNTPTLNNFRFA